MWNDLKSIFRRDDDDPPSKRSSAKEQSRELWPAGFPTEDTSRQSRGLEQFLVGVGHLSTSTILDMGGANQANVNYITNLGHRLSYENLLPVLDAIWNDPSISESRKIEDFLEQTLNYQESSVVGVLMWEMLQYLPVPLLAASLKRLYYLLQPGSMMLAIFHSDTRATTVANYAYRIVDSRTLQLSPRGLRTRTQSFDNRTLEKLFADYSSIKFFLTRDNFREVLVKR